MKTYRQEASGPQRSDWNVRMPLLVMKNNTPECVLLSPEEYIRLLDEVNDARLLNTAVRRMAHFNPASVISQEQVDQEFVFSPSDYENTDDIDFE